jgi:hypothetical protein
MIPIMPSQMPTWATTDQVDDVSGANNVETPPPELQTYGWPRGIFPPRNFFNWLGRYTYEWIAYLAAVAGQSNSVTKAVSTTSGAIFNIIQGGLAKISVVDTASTSNYYEGIVYIPPGYATNTLTFNTIKSSTITISAIQPDGSISVTAGTGPFIIYAQTIQS